MIKHTDWIKLADYIYDGDNRKMPRSGIVYVPSDNIAEFFLNCEAVDEKYIVISANSDYSIQYQNNNPVWADMQKWLNFINLESKQGYNDLLVRRRCNSEYCKIIDKYSVKVYSYTVATFDKIPNNIIKWYGTNLNIEDDRIVRIPFGVPDWTARLLHKTPLENKENKIYVNFQSNTIERLNFKIWARSNSECVYKDEVSKEEYINDLKNYKYILCPEGNGLDSFRILEAIYCGSIPIVIGHVWSEVYTDYAIRIKNPNNLNLEWLSNQTVKNDGLIGDFEYWKEIIDGYVW